MDLAPWIATGLPAAVGLVLPGLLGIAPGLVPVTADCWVLLMIGAIITHLRTGEARFIVLNLVYLALAAYVGWGRFGPAPFPAGPGPAPRPAVGSSDPARLPGSRTSAPLVRPGRRSGPTVTAGRTGG